ncbi:hypothetical protein NPIL_570981 [Nephila pilipes]|uniref:Uncharacterized protein n=1 Tax=Nephila pilipes TaxID=299642 RepID=A0A8X6Q2K9_NEPPI|nr:hypothetical protein NPIL_570981 [Nephila pilipes]
MAPERFASAAVGGYRRCSMMNFGRLQQAKPAFGFLRHTLAKAAFTGTALPAVAFTAMMGLRCGGGWWRYGRQATLLRAVAQRADTGWLRQFA